MPRATEENARHPVGQRRGRAQKKRAKKIKDKMRELCLEAAAAAVSTSGEENASVNQGPHTFSDVSERVFGLADCSDGNQSVGIHRGNRETSDTQGIPLCPRFVRAATDLVALARVRAPCQRCFKTPVLLASESASSSSNTEDTAAAARVATDAAATPAALSRSSPELLQTECVRGNGTRVAMEEPGGSPAANGSRKGISSVDHPCDAGELPPPSAEGNGALMGGLVDGRGIHEKAHVLENRSQGGALESAGIYKEGPLGDRNAVPRYKKTRRGKRAGGASNRRRGHKANEKVRTDETSAAANDAGRGEGTDAGLTVVPLREVGMLSHEEGARGDRNSPGDMASYGDNGHDQDGVCRCTSSCSFDIAAMECAALASLRDLRSMLASPTTARGQTGVDSLLESRLQSSGVLESLVALCAPYPWAPIPLRHGTFPGGLPVRTWGTPEDAGAHGEVANAVETPRSVSAEGVHVDDAVNAAASRNGATRTKTAVCGGLRGAGSREAVMEGALRILSTALEEPKNRDYVLRIDGATPLVRTRTAFIRMFRYTGF